VNRLGASWWLATVGLAAIALAMAALVLTPVRLWHHAQNEATYSGFDRNLIYANPRGNGTTDGEIATSPGSIRLTAASRSDPTVDLVTSPLGFSASLDVRILEATPGSGLTVGIWSPDAASGYFVEFGPSPSNALAAVSVTGGHGSIALTGGTVHSMPLGTYAIGTPYHVSLVLDKASRSITTSITEGASPGTLAHTYVSAAEMPDLLGAFRPTFAVSLSATSGSATAVVENWSLVLPSQPRTAGELVEQIDDQRARILTITLSALGGVAGFLSAIAFIRRWSRRRSGDNIKAARPRVRLLPLAFIPAAAVYFALNTSLFHLGTPHFDIYAAKMWAYIAANYNFADLYHRSLIVPAAGIQAGVPNHEASFPYGPTKVYFYLAIGWIYRLSFGQTGGLIDTFQYEVLLKAVNVAFGLCDAALVYSILARIAPTLSRARWGTVLFALNPALIFIMSIWGSTETVSLFFILLSVWFALTSNPPWAWIVLALGAFTRPQMLVVAFLLSIAYLRVFSRAQNVRGISWAVIAFFIFVAPLSIAISPSLPFDYVTHVFDFQIGTGQADKYSSISPGYYSIWTLPLLYLQGQHGLYRMWYPRTTPLIGSITYTEAAAVIVVVFLLLVAAAALLRRGRRDLGDYLPIVAFGMLGWLMISTSLISRYFLYGVVLLILSQRAYSARAYFINVGWLSLVTLITSWSHFGLDELGSNSLANPLNPVHNPLTRAIQALFFDDRFITEATVINLIVLVYLGFTALRQQRRPRTVEDVSELVQATAS
jgi:hypothetical protein